MRRILKICKIAWTRYGNCPDSPLPSLPLFDSCQECRPAPLFLFSGEAGIAVSPPLQGAQPRHALRSRAPQRSGTERAASPGHGAVQRVWDTGPTSKRGPPAVTSEARFESLWEQRHCLPSSETAKFERILILFAIPTIIDTRHSLRGGQTWTTFPSNNSLRNGIFRHAGFRFFAVTVVFPA